MGRAGAPTGSWNHRRRREIRQFPRRRQRLLRAGDVDGYENLHVRCEKKKKGGKKKRGRRLILLSST